MVDSNNDDDNETTWDNAICFINPEVDNQF